MLGHMLVYKASIQLPKKMSPGPTQPWGPLTAPWEVPGTWPIPPVADWNKAQGRVPLPGPRPLWQMHQAEVQTEVLGCGGALGCRGTQRPSILPGTCEMMACWGSAVLGGVLVRDPPRNRTHRIHIQSVCAKLLQS